MASTAPGSGSRYGTALRTRTHQKRPRFEIVFVNCCSLLSKVLVIVSSLFLLASICMLILSTIPEFQVMTVITEQRQQLALSR